MANKNGGPAFPRTAYCGNDHEGPWETLAQDGMTLRQYYAGQALAGMLANSSEYSVETQARDACAHADALIAALESSQ